MLIGHYGLASALLLAVTGDCESEIFVWIESRYKSAVTIEIWIKSRI